MKPRLPALWLAAAALMAGCGSEEQRGPERFAAPWAVTGVSLDQRTVHLAYEQGGCERDDPRVAVKETKRAVKIKVTERAVEQPSDQICAGVLIVDLLNARLRSPLAGRRIVGLQRGRVTGPPGPFRRRGSYVVELVPRVAGLAVSDATAVLADYGFRARATGAPTDETIATRPGPGAAGTPVSRPRRVVRILSRPRS